MQYNGIHYRTVWMEESVVYMIDQTRLPFEFIIFRAGSYPESCSAIKNMIVRGAGAIGATAGFAMAQAFLTMPSSGGKEYILKAKKIIEDTRPTARNLFYAVDRIYEAGKKSPENAVNEAMIMADENADEARKIGFFGEELIRDGSRILTHCNAGWLGFVDYGSALSPIYAARDRGKHVFVFVDETRPRSQGARLTAWELKNEQIPHAIIPDNASAHYMSKGEVDLIIVGADRIAANGDVANKIGTLDKAILAKEFGIPFYVAAPLSTFDSTCRLGSDIIIEYRDAGEVIYQEGPDDSGNLTKIRVCNPGSDVLNPAFDVTPARYISGIITEKGIIEASKYSIKKTLL